MKVTGKTSVDPKLIQGSDAAQDSKKTSIKDKAVDKDGSKAVDSAKVSLSQKAQDFKKIKAAAEKSDGIDMAKVDRVKQAIKDGKYNIDYDKVADKMIESDIRHGA